MKVNPSATTMHQVDADYPKRPAHRGHTVSIEGWNSDYVMLVIRSDTKTSEAIITPLQLMELAETAKREAHRW